MQPSRSRSSAAPRAWSFRGRHGYALAMLCFCAAALAASCGGSSGAVNASGTTGTSPSTGGTGPGAGGAAGSAAGGTGGTVSAGGHGGGVSLGCKSDKDCKGNPMGAFCATASGVCVQCLANGKNPCPKGQYCDPMNSSCTAGCGDDGDCTAKGDPRCDVATHGCVACLADTDCGPGDICSATHTCVPGCSAAKMCPMGKTCCGNLCFDVTSDVAHCGSCGKACEVPPSEEVSTCTAGVCATGCKPGWADCDGNPMNGCEQNLLDSGPCTCTPGVMQTCYDGPPGTVGVGPCKAGTETCAASGLAWGPCTGEVLPIAEICANNVDDDCNGQVDDVPDIDGDGWNACQGDCCEIAGPKCAQNPALVNPGAYEILNNGIDDDCNPATSDTVAPPDCELVQKESGVTATDLTQALDLCQFTTANPPLPKKIWGVIKAEEVLADGSVPLPPDLVNIQGSQAAVLPRYGTSGNVVPKKGPTFAAISSGTVRVDEFDPTFLAPNGGTVFNTSVNPPAVYLNAHGGALPATAGCSGACQSGAGANDSVNLRLTIRVPTNVLGFSYDFRFFTAEYWTWSCTIYNDFFLALLKTGAPGIPADHNISFDSQKNPVSVNNGFFEDCQQQGCYTCPGGTADLAGTGMEFTDFNCNTPNFFDGCFQCANFPCGPQGDTGGATKWLTTDAPVVPGETITLQLMVWDTSDHLLDSMAILDNFRWNPQPTMLGTHE